MKNYFKKITFSFVAILFAASTVFVSCSKDDSMSPVVQDGDQVASMQPMGPKKGIQKNIGEKPDFSALVGGCRIATPDVYNSIPVSQIKAVKDLPIRAVLDCPEVGNQGFSSSCVGWGVGYGARSIIGGAQNLYSPSYIFNQIKVGDDCNTGSYATDALNLVVNEGVCTYNAMPYSAGDCYTQPSDYARYNAGFYKASYYERVNITTQDIKVQLAAGNPVIVTSLVDSNFQNLGWNRVLTSFDGTGGGHCYVIVGYYDDYNCFEVLNSWGENWSTDGHGFISYDLTEYLYDEAYVLHR